MSYEHKAQLKRFHCNFMLFLAGLRSRSRKESEFFGWSRSRIPDNTGSRSRIFLPTPTPNVQLDHFLLHTPKLGTPVEMVQFLLKLFETEISCCVPRFPLILTAKFHSLSFKESESEIWERSESEVGNFGKSVSDVLSPTPQPWWLAPLTTL